MGWLPPGRLFHAVVLAGAMLGTGCRRPLTSQPPNDGAAQVRDGHVGDSPTAADGSDGRDAVADAAADGIRITLDAAAEAPRDADCDVSCPDPYVKVNCSCTIGIL